MNFPNVISSAFIIAVLAFLQHLLTHVGAFNLNELIAPVVIAILTSAIKMFQERLPAQPEAAARGVAGAEPGYWARVLAG